MKAADARQWHPQQHPHLQRKLSNLAPRNWRPHQPTSQYGLAHHVLPHVPGPHRGQRLVDETVAELLRLLKEHFGMDVVFVPSQPEDSLLSALPAGAFASAAIRLACGDVHGTLVCYEMLGSGTALGERELKRLDMSARLAARLIDGVEVHMAASLG